MLSSSGVVLSLSTSLFSLSLSHTRTHMGGRLVFLQKPLTQCQVRLLGYFTRGLCCVMHQSPVIRDQKQSVFVLCTLFFILDYSRLCGEVSRHSLSEAVCISFCIFFEVVIEK
jgi:hypothetical protein